MTDSHREFFDILARVLLRCWLFGYVLLFIWLAAILLGSDSIYRMHSSMFGLTLHELAVISYGGLGLLKLVVLTFFFIPWLAIRLVLRKAAR